MRKFLLAVLMVVGTMLVGTKAEAKFIVSDNIDAIEVDARDELKEKIKVISRGMLDEVLTVEKQSCKNKDYAVHYCSPEIKCNFAASEIKKIIREVEIENPENIKLEYVVSDNTVQIIKTEVSKEIQDKIDFYEKLGNKEVEGYYERTYKEHPEKSFQYLSLSNDLRDIYYGMMFGAEQTGCEYCENRFTEDNHIITEYYNFYRLQDEFDMFYNENPQFYFLSFLNDIYTKDSYMLKNHYLYSSKKIRDLEPKFYKIMQDYNKELDIKKSDSQLKKIKKINRFVCEKIKYANNLENNKTRALGRLADGNNHLVCVGYSKFFQALCGLNDIKCITVSNNIHCWNLVEYHGKKYMVDCTWNDGYDSDYYLMNKKTDRDHKYHKIYNIIAD